MMKRHELLLAAALLDRAAETFANHGCNDFDLSMFLPTPKERLALLLEYEEWNTHHKVQEWTDRYAELVDEAESGTAADFCLMHFLASKFRSAAKEMP